MLETEISLTENRRTSFSAQGMTIQDFAVWFSKEFGKGIIYESSFNNRKIYAEIRNGTATEISNAVARHLSTELVDLGNTIFIGAIKLDDMGVFVKKVKGVKVADLRAMVASFSGAEGSGLKGHVTDDGVVFLFDKEQGLLPFAKAFDQLASIKLDAWVVQLYLIDFKDEDLQDLGIDLTASGNLAYKMLEGGAGVLKSGFNANVLVDGLIQVSRQTDKIRIVGQPLFVMSDGSNFLIENKDSIPYVKRIATETGFIQDEEVEFIEAGIFIDVKLRELEEGSLLTLKLENSKILRFTENNLPVRNIVKVQSEVPLQTSGVYLIAQSDYVETSEQNKTLGFGSSYKRSTLQVFARVFKIDSKFKGLASR